MIITLGVWLIALSAGAGYGSLLIPYVAAADSIETEATRAYAGLLVLAALLLFVSLFTNLAAWCGLVAAAPGIALSLRSRFWTSTPPFGLLIYAALALLVSTREINLYDTALYHQQAAKWLAEHGLVRGLALLYFRFGWVSSWFALAGPLNHGITEGRPAIIGGLPFALTAVSSLRILHREATARRQPKIPSVTWALLGCLLATVAIVWNVDSSLSPDMVAWLLPLVVVTTLTDPTTPMVDRVGRATLVATLACVVKTTSIPVLVCCAVLLIWRAVRFATERSRLAVYVAPVVLAIALLLASNLISSGCPAYPSAIGCIPTAWSVGADATRAVQVEIQEFARFNRHNQTFALTVAAALASALMLLLNRSDYTREILTLSWAGIALTTIVAPVPRYGLGYFLLPVAAACATAIERLSTRWNWTTATFRSRRAPAMLAASLVAGIPILAGAPMFTADALIYPRRLAAASGDPVHIVNRSVDVRKVLALRSERHGSLTIWTPISSDQCWDAPLPCTPAQVGLAIEARRPENLDGGFIRISK